MCIDPQTMAVVQIRCLATEAPSGLARHREMPRSKVRRRGA